MKNKMPNRDKVLLQRIDEILYYFWDPIGVKFDPNTRNEYESYVGSIFSILKTKNTEEIADKLSDFMISDMGLVKNENTFNSCLSTSELLIKHFEYIELLNNE